MTTTTASAPIYTNWQGCRAIDKYSGEELPFSAAQKADDNPLIWTWVVWK